jgi:hypothetical protein
MAPGPFQHFRKSPLCAQQRPFELAEQFVLVDGWSLVAGSLEHGHRFSEKDHAQTKG